MFSLVYDRAFGCAGVCFVGLSLLGFPLKVYGRVDGGGLLMPSTLNASGFVQAFHITY